MKFKDFTVDLKINLNDKSLGEQSFIIHGVFINSLWTGSHEKYTHTNVCFVKIKSKLLRGKKINYIS